MMKALLFLFLGVFACTTQASCFRLASEEFGIDWRLIYSIAKVESNHNADAINVNNNKSIDVGMMQINTVHQYELANRGIAMNELLDPCKNVIVGTWLLKKSIARADGDIWKGVGFYHSATPSIQLRYIGKVKLAFDNLNRQSPTSP